MENKRARVGAHLLFLNYYRLGLGVDFEFGLGLTVALELGLQFRLGLGRLGLKIG